jgi:DNA polymerase-3 subunit delta'
MDPIIGHEAIQRELRNLAASADPPHAILFCGPSGSGRRPLARLYAMLLNCERAAGGPPRAGMFALSEPASDNGELPCGVCRPCRLIDEGGHPDVVLLAPGDMLCKPRSGDTSHAAHPLARDIRICQVRGVVELAARYPFEARQRMIIVDPADRLTRDAANTMLKTLEEPPGHTIFALLTEAPEAVLETVQSRCRRIDVRTVAKPVMKAGLEARGVAPAVAETAAEAARGRPGLAIAFAAQPDLIGDRERHLRKFAGLAAARAGERLRYAEEQSRRFREERAAVAEQLDIWEAFWERELLTASHEPDPDTRRELVRGNVEALRAITAARENLLANVQPRPALDVMLLSFPRRTLGAIPQDEIAANA